MLRNLFDRAALSLSLAGLLLAAWLVHSHAQSPQASGFTGNPLVAQGEHLVSGGNPPTASSGCGTGPTIIGTDAFGHILLGTGTSQPCTLTFAQAYNNPPSCVVTAESYGVSYNRTSTTLVLTSLLDGVRVSWACIARPGG